MSLYEKMLLKIKELQEKGVPFLWLRSDNNKGPSVSLTILAISVVLLSFSILNEHFLWVDLGKGGAFEFFIAASGLYFSRKITTKNVTIEKKEE
jgi:hypothetical protein